MGEVSCADAFAPKSGEGEGGEGVGGGGLSFPTRPMSLFAVAAYVYDCAGGATPSGANENGETTCQCPAAMVYVDGECVEATAINKCKAKGWDTERFGDLDLCGVNFVNGLLANLTGDRFTDNCILNPRLPEDESCRIQLGANLNFPQRPADGSSPHYAYNCGSTRGSSGLVSANNGLLPASAANGATNCYCEDSTATHFGATVTTVIDNGGGAALSYGGVCLSGESARAAAACEGAGWSLTSDSKGWQCAIPVMRGTLSAGASEGCYLSGVATVALPQCSEVFGANFAFPPKPTGTPPRYVFDYGEKMIPESSNLQGETMCECAATNAQGQCICGGGRVERNNPEGGTHCVCIRGTAEVGGICVNREGPIGGVTVGIAAQVTLCAAFGGEVLRGEGVEAVEGSFTPTSPFVEALIEEAEEFAKAHSSFAPETNALAEAVLLWAMNDADYYAPILPHESANQIVLNYYSRALDSGVPVRNDCESQTTVRGMVDCIFGLIPQGGTRIEAVEGMEGDAYACRGVDKSGTFCLLGSATVFPCRGLFTRARDCNIKYNRPLLNPFLCARMCRPLTTSRGPNCE